MVVRRDTVEKIKKLLFEGIKTTDVATQCKVSQPFVSYVKNGKSYGDVPWPDGSVGAMSALDSKVNERANKREAKTRTVDPKDGWSRFDQTPRQQFEALFRPHQLAELDELAHKEGFADASAMWQHNMAELDKKKQEAREKESVERRAAWDKRLEEMNREIESGERVPYQPPDPFPPVILDDVKHEMMPWEKIMILSRGNIPVVKLAEEANDQDAKDAMGIIFYVVKEPSKWKEQRVLELIYDMMVRVKKGRELNVN